MGQPKPKTVLYFHAKMQEIVYRYIECHTPTLLTHLSQKRASYCRCARCKPCLVQLHLTSHHAMLQAIHLSSHTSSKGFTCNADGHQKAYSSCRCAGRVSSVSIHLQPQLYNSIEMVIYSRTLILHTWVNTYSLIAY